MADLSAQAARSAATLVAEVAVRLRARLIRPPWRRPVMWLQVAIVYTFVQLYDVLRELAPTRATAAFRHARDLLQVEGALHLDVEKSLNAWLADRHELAVAANWFYDTAHYVVTFSVLVFVYVRREAAYRRLRDALLLMNLVGLVGFWLFPLAPPRLLPGYTDTVATLGTAFSETIKSSANEFAAMPSLHLGWALWVSWALLQTSRKVVVRLAAVLYPVLTAFVVIGTANHYLLDIVAGVACAAVGIAVPETVGRLRRAAELDEGVGRLVAGVVPPAPAEQPAGSGGPTGEPAAQPAPRHLREPSG